MAEHPTWTVGDRNPPITETITDSNGDPVDLTGTTVTFSMRAVNSSTDKVANQSATIVTPAAGTVRYSWAAADVDTAGTYLVRWRVTAAGLHQHLREGIVVFEPHDPETNSYLELEQAKSTLELDSPIMDQDLVRSLVSASRIVDDLTGTRFYTTTADEIRYYTPAWYAKEVAIHDLNTLTEVATDDAGGFTYGTVWTQGTDFVLAPFNASLEGMPWQEIHRASNTGFNFRGYSRSLRVTGKFGWATVPANVVTATGIIATQLLTQQRSAPLGVITAFDGTAVRMSRFGPRVDELLAPYKRAPMFA